MHSLRSYLTLSLFSLATLGSSIVIRHDKDDKAYIELGKKYNVVAVVAGNGLGTVVAPQWIITAAHVAEILNPFNGQVTINGKSYAIEAVYPHPTSETQPLNVQHDMALLKLATPIEDVKPVKLYRSSDEVDKIITFVGSGDTGNGTTGPTKNDGLQRAAHNKIAATTDSRIIFKFDAPPEALELEGISGPGDSGGPALIEKNGQLHILGVSSYNSGGPHCTYGTMEHYARVSTAVDWIESTMKDAGAAKPKPMTSFNFSELPKDHAMAATALAFLEAFNSGEGKQVEAYNQKFRSEQFLQRATPEERTKRSQELIDQYGKLEGHSVALGRNGSLIVLLKAGATGAWHCFEFLATPDAPGKLNGILITDAIRPKT